MRRGGLRGSPPTPSPSPWTRTPPLEGGLRHFNAEIQQCSFWTAQSNRMVPIVQTLNKALPQRCQTRDGGETTLSKFAKNPTFAQIDVQWLDCSVLGMYSHS